MPTYRSSKRRFVNSRHHRDREATRCRPPRVPATVLDFLRALPEDTLVRTCSDIGHPSFWLGPGRRYYCLCEEHCYVD